MHAPTAAPDWARDLDRVWNAAEAAEVRVNARVARELVVALPHELDDAARTAAAQELVGLLVDRYGVAVTMAVHTPSHGDPRNHHVHLLFSVRALGPEGFGKKVRCLDDRQQGPKEIEALRKEVAGILNRHLAQAGLEERVDHRTLAAQAREAEAAGDFERAARLTREPLQRVSRAEVVAARRGLPGPESQENGQRRTDHRRALATYLVEARAGRRRLRAAAHAKLAARLAPPGAGLPKGGRGGPRRRPSMEESLMDVVRAGSRMAAAVIQAGGQRDRMADRLAHLESPATKAARQQVAEARLAIEAAKGEAASRHTRLKEAMRLRHAKQQAWDSGGESRPSAWRPARRKAWEVDRRQLWGQLRKAIAAEQAAQADLSPVAKAGLRSRVAEARRKLAEAEAVLRRRLDEPEDLAPDLPPPVTAPTRRPRTL